MPAIMAGPGHSSFDIPVGRQLRLQEGSAGSSKSVDASTAATCRGLTASRATVSGSTAAAVAIFERQLFHQCEVLSAVGFLRCRHCDPLRLVMTTTCDI